jgi:two-component system, NtrC family, response regulator HydG
MPPDKIRVLIVDDEKLHAQAVAESLERTGYSCSVAASGTDGAKRIETEEFDIIVTDLFMNDLDGFQVLQKAKEELPDVEVIMISGHGEIKDAVAAMQRGAYTYLTKPLNIDELRTQVEKASERLRLARTNIELQRQLNERFGFEGVVGNSPEMHQVINRLQQISPLSCTVLIQGETGTGKELVAKAIHNNSPRRNKPFKAINCAAVADSLIESELFGHEKGAFTGADRLRVGTFEYANGGTLFLDEVGDMPLATQTKLLRVIEEGEITRVGSNETVKVNVRLLSATNRDLDEAIAKETFRKELYFRLKVATIKLPPLRQRRGDIPLLTDYFIKELTRTHQKPVRAISATARRALLAFPWPGNVRQLRNAIESMIVVDNDGLLDVDDLQETDVIPVTEAATPVHGSDVLVGKPLEEVEKFYIEQALKLTEGNREEAAKLLGIGERTMYRKIKYYGLN